MDRWLEEWMNEVMTGLNNENGDTVLKEEV